MGIYLSALLISLLFALPSYAQELKVKEVKDKKVVIMDKNTGREAQTKEGDEIGDGWKVLKITDKLVTIEKEADQGQMLRKQMPAGAGHKIEMKKVTSNSGSK